MLQKALLAVDIAIGKLKKRIEAGAADSQIMVLQLADLLERREVLLKEINAFNRPTKEIPK